VEHRCLWEGSVKSGEMRTDAATLIRQLRADGFIIRRRRTPMPLLSCISVEHWCLWEGSVKSGEMRTKAAEFVHDRITTHGER
jgi:hypothetical protein